MKKLILSLFLVGLICAVPPVHASQGNALGFGDAAIKVDWFRFTDNGLADMDLENGVYVGLEVYYMIGCISPNLYFGAEIGWAGTSTSVDPYSLDLNVDYVPVEFNLKYVFDITPCVKFDLGAGISANWFGFEADFGNVSYSSDDWLFGGQFFADLNYRLAPNWFVGANIKYQITQDIELDGVNTHTSADNFRLGAQVGYTF